MHLTNLRKASIIVSNIRKAGEHHALPEKYNTISYFRLHMEFARLH